MSHLLLTIPPALSVTTAGWLLMLVLALQLGVTLVAIRFSRQRRARSQHRAR